MPPTSPHQSHLITQHEQQAHTLNLNLLINSVQKNSNFRLLPSGSPTTAPFYSPPALTTTHARSTRKNPFFSPHNTSTTKMSTCDLYQLFFPQQHTKNSLSTTRLCMILPPAKPELSSNNFSHNFQMSHLASYRVPTTNSSEEQQ